MEDLPKEFMIENCLIKVELLENKTGEISAWVYLLSIAEIVNSALKIGTGALLIVNNYILGLIWGNEFIYLLDSHSKDEYGNLSSSGTTVLLKFESLNSLENYIRSVYYNTFPQVLYFQVQLIKVHCSSNTKTGIKFALKRSNYQKDGREIWILKKENIIIIQRRKEMQLKRDITIKRQ